MRASVAVLHRVPILGGTLRLLRWAIGAGQRVAQSPDPVAGFCRKLGRLLHMLLHLATLAILRTEPS